MSAKWPESTRRPLPETSDLAHTHGQRQSWCAFGGRATRLAFAVAALGILAAAAIPAAALALPDGRAYEVVTPQNKNGIQVGAGIGSTSGNAVDWESIGGCCGATSSAATLYQSTRTSTGWQTTALTPKPPTPLVGLFAEQAPVWWSLDLSKTIYTTPASYAAGDQRPAGPGVTNYLDLYEQGSNGSMSWLSQGPFPGAGTNPDTATFDGASPDGDHVAFDTQEQLTPGATGLASLNTPAQFLYERNVAEGTTNLVDVQSGTPTTTSLTAPGTGRAATTLSTGALGTVATSLTNSAGPAVNTRLSASAGPEATTLTAPATGAFSTTLSDGAGPAVNTTLTSAASAGATTINLADATNLEPGEQITLDPATPCTAPCETATISAIGSQTSEQLSGTFNGGATGKFLSDPTGVALDQTSADVYVVDTGNFRVEKFDSSGNFILAFGGDVDATTSGNVCTAASGDTCQAGTQGSTAPEFTTPQFVAVDNSTGGDGDVYVGDPGDDTISKFDSSGNLISTWASSGQLSGSGTFGSIDGIAVDSSGDLLVINSGNSVYKYSQSNGSAIGNFPTTRGMDPDGLAVGSSGATAGNLFKVNGDGSVEEVTNTGTDIATVSGDVAGPTATEIAIDPTTGDLLVDSGTSIGVFEFNGSGDVIESTGPACAPGPSSGCNPTATFGSPSLSGATGVAGSIGTNVFVADAGNENVAIFVPSAPTTPVTLTAPLANNHAPGASVTHAADSSITVASSANFLPGQQITIGIETATVASVPNSTTIDLTAALTSGQAPGATVSYGGDTSITVANSAGFVTGEPITIGTGAADQETATIASVPNSTTIDLVAGLANDHASGESVNFAANSITVASTNNLVPGETITIDTSGSGVQETATIASVEPATGTLLLTAPLAHDHASGAPVTYPGDSSITVGSTTGLSAGQQLTIDAGTPAQETDTIASVPNSTTIDLTLTKAHQAGATVTREGDTSITVASTTGFAPGQTIAIDTGSSQEAATIASVPDTTHLALTAPLTNDHAAGARVAYGGDTTITVVSTAGIAAGQPVDIGTGAGQDSATVATVPDSTHITLTSGLVNDEPSGAPVEAFPALVSPDGAILGNGNWLAQGFEPADVFGTTTNAVSSDGSLLYFESPPSSPGGGNGAEGVGPPNLYLGDESDATTTLIASNAIYEGAAQDGSLAFYTSGGQLYEFNSTGATIGQAASMSSFSISQGQEGAPTAIANDGSHVYFVSTAALTSNNNAQSQGPTADEPNLYVFNTSAPTDPSMCTASNDCSTTFIATLSPTDQEALTAEPDIARPAIPSCAQSCGGTGPDGTVLVFEASSNLTGQNSAASTTLGADASPGDTSITVTSATGFKAGQTITIGTGGAAERDGVTGVSGSTLDLVNALSNSHSTGDPVDQQAPFEVYRYATADGSLTCVSCVPAGVLATGSADLGASGGGSYEPAGEGVPMSSNGSIIFFDSPDPLVAGVNNDGVFPNGVLGSLVLTENVFEWENGKVSLISNGNVSTGAELGSTTPSGNDVFFNTAAQLVPQDTDGYVDIYDARVSGGFPAPSSAATTPCDSAQSCRTTIAATPFFPVPASSTLIEPNVGVPTFSVKSISAQQRASFVKTGRLTLTVTASSAGQLTATASATIAGNKEVLSTATASLFATGGGTAKLTLTLTKAARNALAKKHKLVVDITVSYSESNQVNVATVTLTKGKTKKKTQRRAAAVHRKRKKDRVRLAHPNRASGR